MKTELKAIAIATIVTCLLIVGCAYATPACAEAEEFYPTTAVVIELDYQLEKVTCVTYDGTVYEFYSDESWHIGDVCSLYMWSCGTEDVTDDEILDVTFGGHLGVSATVEWLDH